MAGRRRDMVRNVTKRVTGRIWSMEGDMVGGGLRPGVVLTELYYQ